MRLLFAHRTKIFNYVILLLWVFFVVSCTIVGSTIPEETLLTDSASTPNKIENDPVESLVITMIELTPMPTQAPVETVLPTTTPVLPTSTEDNHFIQRNGSLKGPLVGFRGIDNEGDLFVILDIEDTHYRELRENISHPFGKIWYGNGCEIYVGSGLINLKGDVVWRRPDLDWGKLLSHEGAYNKTSLLSPDRQWLAYDILYGEQYYEDTEFLDIGVINLFDPSNPVLLTSDGQANRFSWSPNSLWLAYKHVDKDGIPQLFRVSPNGDNLEQLTFHSERMGIRYITWSPDSRYIAYAGYQSNDQGQTGIGWVDVIDTQTLDSYRILPQTDNFGGVYQDRIWWALDGMQLAFSGRNWQGSANSTQIYWVNMLNKTIVDSYFAWAAPEGRIDEVYAVGGVNRILFSVYNDLYLLNVDDKNYEPIPFDLNFIEHRYDSESAPFNFPGEENCQ